MAKKIIEIEPAANGEARYLELIANSTTPHLFKSLFNMDLLKSANQITKAENDTTDSIFFIQRIAFVMNAQTRYSTKDILNKLTIEDFIIWLDDFIDADFVLHAEDILNVWFNSLNGNSKLKKA